MKHYLHRYNAFVILLAISSICSCLISSSYADEQIEGTPLFVTASIRTRNEYANWFGPKDIDKEYFFHSLRAQIGLGAEDDWYKAYLQEQISWLYDLPIGATGVGGVYRSANDDQSSPIGTKIRQGYVSFRDKKNSTKSLQLGRFLYSSGEEKLSDNTNVKWLQQKRIGQRLIGPFDYVFGRSFDGLRADYTTEQMGTITLVGIKPTEGGFVVDGMESIDEITVTGATLSNNYANSSSQVFSYLYKDDRLAIKPDNRPLASRELDTEEISLITFGGSYATYTKYADLGVDSVLWAVGQTGDWGGLMQQSYSYVAEAGLHFETVPGKPALRLGYTYGSGDSDPNDSRHQTFFQMLPTARMYAMTPFYNMQNNQDIYAQFIVTPSKSWNVKSEFHLLHLAQGADLLFGGGGAGESKNRFGYSGVSLNGNSQIGSLWDIDATYSLTDNISTTLYYGHLFAGDALSSTFAGGSDDIDYSFLELNFKL